MRSDIVREDARIPEDEIIMTCVAMGYPDDNFAANAVRSDREGNADFVRYVGFRRLSNRGRSRLFPDEIFRADSLRPLAISTMQEEQYAD